MGGDRRMRGGHGGTIGAGGVPSVAVLFTPSCTSGCALDVILHDATTASAVRAASVASLRVSFDSRELHVLGAICHVRLRRRMPWLCCPHFPLPAGLQALGYACGTHSPLPILPVAHRPQPLKQIARNSHS